jgi:hypothetical protein
VALFALHLLVETGQGITGLIMVELSGSIFPVDEVMALQAILSQSPFVKVFVASHAFLRNPQEGFAQVLLLYVGALGGGNFLGQVTFIAGQAGVFAFQQVSGFFMIELVRIPLDQRKIHAVVIGVAAHAFLAGAGGNVIGTVQAAFGRDSRANIGVTANAFELRLAASDFVAIGAVQGAVEKLMLPRQWAGRNLRRSRSHQRTKNCQLQEEE